MAPVAELPTARDQTERCPRCDEPRLRAVIAFKRTQVWLEPDPSEFGHISVERPAHGGRPVAYPLQGSELADARQHGDPLYRRHECALGRVA